MQRSKFYQSTAAVLRAVFDRVSAQGLRTVAVTISDKGGKEMAQATIMERTMRPIGAYVGTNEFTIDQNLKSLAKEIATVTKENRHEAGRTKKFA